MPKQKNPLSRRIGTYESYDWERATRDVHTHFPKVEEALKEFLAGNPLWGCNAGKYTHPGRISMSFYLKPEAYPRRKTMRGNTAQPERVVVIPDEDKNPVADLIASILRQCPGLKAQLDTRDGYLFYDLKVANMQRYRR